MTSDDDGFDDDGFPTDPADLIILLLASVCAWGLIIMLLWAASIVAHFVWRLVEPLLTVLAVGVALVVIVLGIGLPG